MQTKASSLDDDEHDEAVEEEERHASDHQKFMQRLHMRELA